MDSKHTLLGKGCPSPGHETQQHKKLQPRVRKEHGTQRKHRVDVTESTHFWLPPEARLHNRFFRRSLTHKQEHNTATEQHWAAFWSTQRSTAARVNKKTVAQDATHRVVSPGYGWLSGGIRIHCVDDCLPLPFLVDLPKAPTGLPVRGLSLEVLLIFVHIVHLETIGREGHREKGGVTVFAFIRAFSLLSPHHSSPNNTHTLSLINPTFLYSIFDSSTSSLAYRPSCCVKIEVCVGCTPTSKGALTTQKKRHG